MSGVEGVEREDYDEREAGVETASGSRRSAFGTSLTTVLKGSRSRKIPTSGKFGQKWGTHLQFTAMLYMVIEQLKNTELLTARFQRNGECCQTNFGMTPS
jgi:hypothetical protein